MNKQQQRAEVRHILRFIRAANRLREITTRTPLAAKLNLIPARPATSGAEGAALILSGYQIVSMTDWSVVENLVAKLRPLFLDSEKCSFRKIVKMLPSHIDVANDSDYQSIEQRWDAILSDTTAPMPEGTRFSNLFPGVDAVATTPGRLTINFESSSLTGREAIELLMYGELVHLDAPKERKLLRVRKTDLADGYKVAVLSVLASLLYLVDHLRAFAQGFIDQLPPLIVEEIESETDTPA